MKEYVLRETQVQVVMELRVTRPDPATNTAGQANGRTLRQTSPNGRLVLEPSLCRPITALQSGTPETETVEIITDRHLWS